MSSNEKKSTEGRSRINHMGGGGWEAVFSSPEPKAHR